MTKSRSAINYTSWYVKLAEYFFRFTFWFSTLISFREKIEKYLKKLDVELQKFKLELEADHAGITSKLEQVISSTISSDNGSGNMDSLGTNGQCSLNGGSSVYKFGHDQISDFTLNSSATTNELMKMMAHTTNAIEANINSRANAPGLNKRKNSNFTDRTRQDDDESKKIFFIRLFFQIF